MSHDVDFIPHLDAAQLHRPTKRHLVESGLRKMASDRLRLARLACQVAIVVGVSGLVMPASRTAVVYDKATIEHQQRARIGRHLEGGYRLLGIDLLPQSGRHQFEMTVGTDDHVATVAGYGDLGCVDGAIRLAKKERIETTDYRSLGGTFADAGARRIGLLGTWIGGAFDAKAEITTSSYAQSIAGSVALFDLPREDLSGFDCGDVIEVARTADGLRVVYTEGMGIAGWCLAFVGAAGVVAMVLARRSR